MNALDHIKALVNDDKIHTHLAYLRDRWADERDYEDWDDYKHSMITALANYPVTLLRATKRPFGMVITVQGDEYAAPWKVWLKRKGRYEVLTARREVKR